ncbi:MAG: hypothetical protein HXS47_00110 [Theionarchaea archaeon]|nr:hypothetical protein [Theionarchaea archaeon]
MNHSDRLTGDTLLLMGSKAFSADALPRTIRELIDEAMASHMTIIVGEVPGACHLFQEYLYSKGYTSVIVGHVRSIRYNAGDWKTVQYGDTLIERERSMITSCTSAIILWYNNSSVIARNLELLKKLAIPTFLYEYSSETGESNEGWLDPHRTYDPSILWNNRQTHRGK